MLDIDTKRDIEALKVEIARLEDRERILMQDLESIRAEKLELTNKLKTLSNDNNYQADMLQRVYEQRHGKTKTPTE